MLRNLTHNLVTYLACIFMVSVAADDTPVEIPDPNLLSAIRSAISKPVGVITVDDMEKLTVFTASRKLIRDLKGLEAAKNLTRLDLSWNKIVDISPLAGLTGLRELDLNVNDVSSLVPVTNLTNLEKLHLWANEINNIGPVAGLTNLTSLYLSTNNISDLSPVSNLKKLLLLYLWDNNISNLTPLSGLTSLRGLYLDSNRISNVEPISGLNNLRDLDLHDNLITNVSSLVSLSNTETNSGYFWLDLSSNNISDFTPLASINRSEGYYLWISSTNLTDVSPFLTTNNLGSLRITSNSVNFSEGSSQWEFLYDLVRKGTTVEFDDPLPLDLIDENFENAIRDALGKSSGVIGISDMQELRVLDASSRSISSIQGLGRAINLREANLSGNSIIDIQPVAAIPGLTLLDLRATALDLSPGSPQRVIVDNLLSSGVSVLFDAPVLVEIADLNLLQAIRSALGKGEVSITATDLLRLQTLHAIGMSISDLSGLEKATNLTELYIPDNDISDLGPLTQLSRLERLDVSLNSITDLSSIGELSALIEAKIFDNPLDLSEGSTQHQILTQLETANGTKFVIKNDGFKEGTLYQNSDPEGRVLNLIWTRGWILESSFDLDNWTESLEAKSPIHMIVEGPSRKYWRLRRPY